MGLIMARRYFKLTDDVYVSGRWELGVPRDQHDQKVWTWPFRRGEPVDLAGRLRIPLSHPGKPLDFSVAGAAVPVVHPKVAAVFSKLASRDVQLIPTEVEGQSEGYFILNALCKVRCIDDAACEEVQYWTAEDDQPDMVGQYRAVAGMRIDPTKVRDEKVFRPWGWPVVLIVSEEIKEALEREGVTGMKFQDVTGPGEANPEERERQRMERYKRTDTLREGFWRTLGTLDAQTLTPIAGGDEWPGRRQAWRLIHRPSGSKLLVTDGMSDFDADSDEPSVGFGLELALETDDLQGPMHHSWQYQVLARVGDEVTGHDRLKEWLKKGMMSMEVSGEDMPPELVTEEGRVGVLLGIKPSTLPLSFDMPEGSVRLVTIQVLLPVELEFLLAEGKGGSEEMARRFIASGQEHRVRAQRPSVV